MTQTPKNTIKISIPRNETLEREAHKHRDLRFEYSRIRKIRYISKKDSNYSHLPK